MYLKAIIIDDEESARETLSGLIRKYIDGVDIIAQADSVSTGFAAIQQTTPDVVFLDIRMSAGSGFDLLEKLPSINFEIIFTTAYDRYALKAFKFSALDYLLKPISPSELKEAINKVRKRKGQGETGTMYSQNLDFFSENLKKETGEFRKIVLPSSNGLVVKELIEIVRCEGYKNYTTFYFSDKQQLVVSRTLKDFEGILEGHGFVRIFQSHLVNIKHVKKYIKGRGGFLEMTDGSMLTVSREKKTELLGILNGPI